MAQEDELFQALLGIDGIGFTLAGRIATERSLAGDFLSPEDFNRRVRGISISRLEDLCERSNLSVSLFTARRRNLTSTRRRRRLVYHVDRSLLGVDHNRTRSAGAQSNERISVVLSTWNTGKMSRYSPSYEKKVRNLVRFVEDSGVDVLCLQEVCESVPDSVCSALKRELRTGWKVLRSCTKQASEWDSSLAILYRSRVVTVRMMPVEDKFPVSIRSGFKRAPQLVSCALKGEPDCAAVLLHVHLSFADPTGEIARLARAAREVTNLSRKPTGLPPILLVVGDFNMNADAISFEPMRQAGLVELVRPKSLHPAPHPYVTLDDATTVGGQWYDNVWIPKNCRGRITNAWCFDFGGRSRSLQQSGYAFAGDRKAVTSDHLPVVVELNLNTKTTVGKDGIEPP